LGALSLALADYPITLRVDEGEIDVLGGAAARTESEVRMKRDGNLRFRHQGVCLLCAAPGAVTGIRISCNWKAFRE
jgi:hypothetical protein